MTLFEEIIQSIAVRENEIAQLRQENDLLKKALAERSPAVPEVQAESEQAD